MSLDTTEPEEPKRRGGPLQFWKEVRSEARKVTWATVAEVRISTILVLMMTAAAAVFFYVVDSLLRFLVGLLLSLGGHG